MHSLEVDEIDYDVDYVPHGPFSDALMASLPELPQWLRPTMPASSSAALSTVVDVTPAACPASPVEYEVDVAAIPAQQDELALLEPRMPRWSWWHLDPFEPMLVAPPPRPSTCSCCCCLLILSHSRKAGARP
jgi:hypothetical protein